MRYMRYARVFIASFLRGGGSGAAVLRNLGEGGQTVVTLYYMGRKVKNGQKTSYVICE